MSLAETVKSFLAEVEEDTDLLPKSSKTFISRILNRYIG
jgi:hypothetical protein